MSDRLDRGREIRDFQVSIARPGVAVAAIDDQTNLIDAGVIDSLAVIEIILYLEESHGVDFGGGDVDPARLSSIASILDLVESAR